MNIILAHGILGFDQKFGIEYFNGIKAHLENKYADLYNLKVSTPEVDPTADIETRGKQLRWKILEALGETGKPPTLNPHDETHIIAHSMGGLDSRYILSPNHQAPAGEKHAGEIITSLTTVGTPHNGSPIADWIYRVLDGEADFTLFSESEKQIINLLRIFNISNKGLRDLTTDAMRIFNATYADNETVRYFWIAGIGRPGLLKTSKLFLALYEYIRVHNLISINPDDRESDGVVPLSSAKREVKGWKAIGDLWHTDHADEVGHDLDHYVSPLDVLTELAQSLKNRTGTVPPPSSEILAHYDEIVDRIAPLKKH